MEKYDRQLRFWGADGQASLSASRVCVLGSSSAASETLKNLVLPGIGKFVVVDDQIVEERDLGINYFVDPEDVGKPRAEAICRLLSELNEDIDGEAFVKNPRDVVNDDDFLCNFDLIIGCGISLEEAASVCETCAKGENGLFPSFIWVRSVGFYGSIRIYTVEHSVLNTRMETGHPDLRLDSPFASLKEFADKIDFESCDNGLHAHIPYVALLVRALEEFRKQHNGRSPSSPDDQQWVINLLAQMRRSLDEVNFDEALQNVHQILQPPEIMQRVKTILDEAIELREPPTDFWVVAKAVARFVQKTGRLPLSGVVPDMTSDSSNFVQLQKLYQEQAEKDYQDTYGFVEAEIADLPIRRDPVDGEYVRLFCKHAAQCEVTRYRSVQQEITHPNAHIIDVEHDEEESLLYLYFLLQAAEIFHQKAGHWPGATLTDEPSHESVQAEVGALKSIYIKLVDGLNIPEFKIHENDETETKRITSFVMCGGVDIHCISSFLGGVASQEAVKLLTLQFTPLNNTFLWDGMVCRSQVLEM